MPRFFIPHEMENTAVLEGDIANHMLKSLRMREGEEVTLCCQRTDYRCVITRIAAGQAEVRVVEALPNETEPSLNLTLFQGLPKGDKMDFIVMKAVELGVSRIVPVLTSRSVSRPDDKAAQKKQARWQKIAGEAAQQSGRGIVPRVEEILPFEKAMEELSALPLPLVFYEAGGRPLLEIWRPEVRQAGIFIGPEGGIAPAEMERMEAFAQVATLGRRILRTETAGIAAAAILMHMSGDM